METITWRDLELSRLTLGTVQFGMTYGIANRRGQPSFDDVLEILTAAVDLGVTCLDTAAMYGNSEEILGRALDELGLQDRVAVVTKVAHLTPDVVAQHGSPEAAVRASIDASRQRLRRECLDIVLFHREADAQYLPILDELRQAGKLCHPGVSAENIPGPAREFAAAPCVAALQIPANLLDDRHEQSGVFATAAERDLAVFVRSVYLQGLLVMPVADIPESLAPVRPVRKALARIAADAGMGMPELALRYMLGKPGVTSVLTGCETVAQVRENAAIVSRGPLPDDVQRGIAELAIALPERVITPHLWG